MSSFVLVKDLNTSSGCNTPAELQSGRQNVRDCVWRELRSTAILQPHKSVNQPHADVCGKDPSQSLSADMHRAAKADADVLMKLDGSTQTARTTMPLCDSHCFSMCELRSRTEKPRVTSDTDRLKADRIKTAFSLTTDFLIHFTEKGQSKRQTESHPCFLLCCSGLRFT